ncbi:MAG: hypothetical protein IT370_01835 [Deltaproteobacteria bacterium]|nr:hypothetical protein [Deltaproteobacteria bacterium]
MSLLVRGGRGVAALLALAMVAAGCGAGNGAVEWRDAGELIVEPGPINRDVDLLFVIDNTDSIADEQQELVPAFRQMLERLERPGALPNLHVGVVSTDLGAPFEHRFCTPDGDRGVLQNQPMVAGCMAPQGRFIADVASPTGRVRNYVGRLDDTFGCIARLGIEGCPREQGLQAMKRALDGSAQENADFLRPNALLVVIIMGEDDDCSVRDPALFDPDNSALGPPLRYRCFEYGVVCKPSEQDRRSTGPRTDCRSDEQSHYLDSVASYVDFLVRLKGSRSRVVVGAIVGTGKVVVGSHLTGEPWVLPGCESIHGPAAPGIRLSEFARSFGFNGFVDSICQDGYGAGLERIADRINQLIEPPPAAIADGGLD